MNSTERKILPHSRRREIFKLLIEHGPLSLTAMRACIYPPIKKKRLYEVIKRLTKRRLIVKRMNKSTERGSSYYQITQEPKGLKAVASAIGIIEGNLRQPQFRRIELFHSEMCAIWKELLCHLFPKSEVVREHLFASNPQATLVLLGSQRDTELRPDLLLFDRNSTSNELVSVAVEIERNHKSRERLTKKLRKYTNQSLVDGVIYVCDSTQLSSRLRDVYQSDVVKNAPRINHYGVNFFLFTDGSLSNFGKEPEMFNGNFERVSLADWLNTLKSTRLAARRDSKFSTPGL